MERLAVVSGANRGIGLEITRQLASRGIHVVVTSRDAVAGQAARAMLEGEGHHVAYHVLDVASEQSVGAFAGWLQAEHGGVDILVNNAGIVLSGFNIDVVRNTLEVNFFGALRLTEALLPLMRQGGRIVMVSSGAADRSTLAKPLRARFEEPAPTREEVVGLMRKFIADVAERRTQSEGWPPSAYLVSKIGLNLLTSALGRELAQDGRGILCNAACPGWVRTEMGGPHATRSVEEGADTPVWLSLLPPDGPQGGFFRDQQPVAW